MMENYEILGVIVALASLGVAIIRTWQTNRARMDKHKEFVLVEIAKINEKTLDNTREIAENRQSANVEIEKIRKEKLESLRAIYAEIESIKKMRESDVRDLTQTFEKAIEKSSAIEQKHHDEVMAEIKSLNTGLTRICATFEEYRKKGKD